MKIITTPEYLLAHDNLEELKGQDLKLFTTDSKLDIDFFNKIMALKINPQFIPVTENDLDFEFGYIAGRILQSNQEVIILTDRGFTAPVAMGHSRLVICDDFKKALSTLKAQMTASNKEAKADEESDVNPAPVRKRGRKPSIKNLPVEAPKAEPVEEKVEVATTEVAAPEEVNDDTEVNTVAQNDEIFIAARDALRKCNLEDQIKRSNKSEDEFVNMIIYAIAQSYEYVSYQVQLDIAVCNKPLADEIWKLTRNVYQELKPLVDKFIENEE